MISMGIFFLMYLTVYTAIEGPPKTTTVFEEGNVRREQLCRDLKEADKKFGIERDRSVICEQR